MASQITGVSIVRSTVSGADQGNHQSSASLSFARGIHRWPVAPSQRASNAVNVSIWYAMKTWIFIQQRFFAIHWARDIRVGNSHITMTSPKLHGVSYHRQSDCCITACSGLPQRNLQCSTLPDILNRSPPVTGGFPSQRDSCAQSASMSQRHNKFGDRLYMDSHIIVAIVNNVTHPASSIGYFIIWVAKFWSR